MTDRNSLFLPISKKEWFVVKLARTDLFFFRVESQGQISFDSRDLDTFTQVDDHHV